MRVICQGCGVEAVCQADEQIAGNPALYACRNGCIGWMEVDENTLPLALEFEEEE